MSSPAINTLVKMMETLPENVQNQVVDLLRAYIADIQDETAWENSYKRSEENLVANAKRAKMEIAEGKATPMDFSRL